MKKSLKGMLIGKNNYNLRERINIYGGVALGVLTPIAALRYLAMPSTQETAHPFIYETLAWGVSAAANIGASILPFKISRNYTGLPLIPSTIIGAEIGISSAESLKQKRVQKEQNLEAQLSSI